jgi:hypothetical protein
VALRVAARPGSRSTGNVDAVSPVGSAREPGILPALSDGGVRRFVSGDLRRDDDGQLTMPDRLHLPDGRPAPDAAPLEDILDCGDLVEVRRMRNR